MSASTLTETDPVDRRRHPRRATNTDLVVKVLSHGAPHLEDARA